MGRSFAAACCSKICRMIAAALLAVAERIERSRVLLAFLALLVALGAVFLLQETIDGASFLLTELHP